MPLERRDGLTLEDKEPDGKLSRRNMSLDGVEGVKRS
jgi:hypothetical protein